MVASGRGPTVRIVPERLRYRQKDPKTDAPRHPNHFLNHYRSVRNPKGL